MPQPSSRLGRPISVFGDSAERLEPPSYLGSMKVKRQLPSTLRAYPITCRMRILIASADTSKAAAMSA